MKTRIKICCISSVEEAKLAIKYGANALGLVSEMPSGPGVIDEKTITEIATIVPPGVSSFLLTSRTNAEEIIDQQKRCKTNVIQICDRINSSEYQKLRSAMPGISLVQVIHVTDQSSVEEAVSVSNYVDAILLDSGNLNAKVKELGGTGRIHNWELSREIVERSKASVFLAGGLNPSNAQEALAKVRPYGLDICSGVRTNGRLDEKKLADFFAAIKTFSEQNSRF